MGKFKRPFWLIMIVLGFIFELVRGLKDLPDTINGINGLYSIGAVNPLVAFIYICGALSYILDPLSALGLWFLYYWGRSIAIATCIFTILLTIFLLGILLSSPEYTLTWSDARTLPSYTALLIFILRFFPKHNYIALCNNYNNRYNQEM